MRFSQIGLFIIPLILVTTSCTHMAPAPSAKRGTASIDSGAADKIAAYFNEGLPTQGEDIPNRVLVKEGQLVAVDANSKSGVGHFMEDCRKVAVRQAILDTTSAGFTVSELSRKGSHRLTVMWDEAGYDEERVGAIVDVRAKDSQGESVEASYFYKLYDDSSGDCQWQGLVSKTAGMSDRRAVEAMVQNDYWPKLTDQNRERIKDWFQNRFGVSDDKAVVEKSVGKLIEWECEQYSINKAVQLSQAYFQSQYGVQPIVLLDFAKSSLTSNLNSLTNGAARISTPLEHLEGNWVVRMADPTGTHFATTRVSFKLKEKKDKCEGEVADNAEVVTQ